MDKDFIKLYVANVSVFEDESLFNEALSNVSLLRRQKIKDLRFRRDKRLSLGVECLLRIALSNEGRTDFEYQYDSNGKPYIKGNLFVNLSHSGEMAICAISNQPVGCDVEIIKPAKLNLAKKYFTENENKLLENDADTMFCRIWSAKESFIKFTGLGFRQHLKTFEVDLCKDEILYSNRVYHLNEFNLDDKYRCCVCSLSDVPTELIEVDLSKK